MKHPIYLIAALLLLALLVACAPSEAAIQAAIQATAEAVPTDTPAPTDTPIPTDTPTPTNTPRPTSTPRPTKTPTPRPTSTPRPTATPDLDRQFLIDAGEVAELYVYALQGLADQSKALGGDIGLLFNTEWKTNTDIYLIMITAAGERTRNMIPSDKFRAIHADMVEASIYYDLAVKFYSEGVAEVDADKMGLATENLNNGTDALNRATTKLNAMD